MQNAAAARGSVDGGGGGLRRLLLQVLLEAAAVVELRHDAILPLLGQGENLARLVTIRDLATERLRELDDVLDLAWWRTRMCLREGAEGARGGAAVRARARARMRAHATRARCACRGEGCERESKVPPADAPPIGKTPSFQPTWPCARCNVH